MGVVAAKYSILIRPDLTQAFWGRMRSGGSISEAVELIDTSRRTGRRILVDAGGVRPRRGRDLKGRCLTFAQREEIAIRHAVVAGVGYRATSAHALAFERASRPKPAKLHLNAELRAKVERDLKKKYSPEQISGRLKREFPHWESQCCCQAVLSIGTVVGSW